MKPRNVILMLADQHHAGVLGSAGHPDALTPHLDAMARGGARLNRTYCQAAVCVPSRCSLISGQYPRTLGCLWNEERHWRMDHVVPLQAAFRMRGHATAAFGKRHLYQGCDLGWDERASHLRIESPEDNYVDWLDRRGLLETFAADWGAEFGSGPETSRLSATPYPRAPLTVRDTALPADATMEAWTAQRTIAFLERQKASGRPFFCLANFYRPHQPYTPLPAWRERFDASRWGRGRAAGDGLAMPAGFDRDPLGLPTPMRTYRTADGEPWCVGTAHREEGLFRSYLAAYYGLVAEIDHHVGAILDALRRLGLADDTVVVYSADHGDFAGEHGLVEKAAWAHSAYEATVRVPLLLTGPGIAPGRVSDDLVELVDLYPTLLELCGVPTPDLPLRPAGRSLARHLASGEPVGRTHAFCEVRHQMTVIGRDQKLARWQDRGTRHGDADLLFERGSDPHELCNRIADPALSAQVAELDLAQRAWAARVG
jgi:arylsulfatase A-like enzyme